jgi:hypothetical protein
VVALACGAPAVAASHAAPRTGPPHGWWIAGDLHVHTIYGHDTCITASEAWDPTKRSRAARTKCDAPYTLGYPPADRLAEAKDRGLDFVALTDHNNVVNQRDPKVLAWEQAHRRFIVVPGYENSQAGHVQMLGARSCYGNHGAMAHRVIECDAAVKDRSLHGMRRLARGLRRAGGIFQVNHPSDRSWLTAYHRRLVPDTIEAWNIGPWAYQSPLPSSNDNDFSLHWYDGFLKRGDRIGVTGGSDSHWQSTDAVQGIGDPTTWVFVRHRTLRGVLAGLRAHHTFVSTLPPSEAGPQLRLTADADHDGGFEAIAGSLSSRHATYRLATTNALPGSMVRIVTDRGERQVSLPTSGQMSFRLGRGGIPSARRFVRAELLAPDEKQLRVAGCYPFTGTQTTLCHSDLAVESLTSPIFIPSRQHG